MRSTCRIVLTVLALYAGVGLSVFAAQSQSSVKAEVDKAFVTIGERIQFRVTVTRDAQDRVVKFDAEPSLSDFEIKEATPFSTEEGGRISEGTNYVLTTYELGEYVIRPFQITIQHQDGSLEEIETSPLYLTVQSVGSHKNEVDDIRGVKGVRAVSGPLLYWLGGGAILLWISLFLFWRAWQKKESLKAAAAAPPLSPHEEAYQALYQLKHSDFLRKGDYKTYFFRMSEILKHYFERRYGIHAMESTTYEVLKMLREHAGQDSRQLIQSALEFCDCVKFAKYLPEVQEILRLNREAVQVVDMTKETSLASAAASAPVPA